MNNDARGRDHGQTILLERIDDDRLRRPFSGDDHCHSADRVDRAARPASADCHRCRHCQSPRRSRTCSPGSCRRTSATKRRGASKSNKTSSTHTSSDRHRKPSSGVVFRSALHSQINRPARRLSVRDGKFQPLPHLEQAHALRHHPVRNMMLFRPRPFALSNA